jgi:hypothetical protein
LSIEIVRHAERWRGAVEAFNERMRAGGSQWGQYVDPEDTWLPERPGAPVWRELYLAVEDGTHVRGGFVLKPQPCWLRGKSRTFCDYQGPVSEGLIDRRHSLVAIRMLRDMLKRQPLLYSWGHGASDGPVLEILTSLGFWIHSTPICLRVLRPARSLHRNAWLRATPARRIGLDLLAGSGIGWLGLSALHGALDRQWTASRRVSYQEVPRFEAWADELWERCRSSYTLVGARDARTLNTLLPHGRWPPGVRLRVFRGGRTIGYVVVMDSEMKADRRFGDLHVGSIIDCFGAPGDAADVVWAGYRFLRQRGVDLIASNQAHPEWVRGLARCGFVALAGRREFAASPALRSALEPLPEGAAGIHLTNLDGHGPMAL